MRVLRGTLVSDGSSDQMLLPVLRWLGREHDVKALELVRPNLGCMPNPPTGLSERIQAALYSSPCDILFLHRDAESCSYQARAEEITKVVDGIGIHVPHVRIIPIRMSEAWLLIDEHAIRRVAQKPNGRTRLHMPRIAQLEGLADPKTRLIELLLEASESHGRRLDQLKRESRQRIHQVAEFISDYSPLRGIAGFRCLEAEFADALAALAWPAPSAICRQAHT